MKIIRDGDILRCGRYEFRVQIAPDDEGVIPWEDCDGHGVIREVRDQRNKYAGERAFGCRWLYDIPETIVRAKRERWGLGPVEREVLAAKLKREPTAKEITAEAVELNFAYVKGWADDDWSFMWYRVVHLDEDGCDTDLEESYGGFDVWLYDEDKNRYFYDNIRDAVRSLVRGLELEIFPELRQRGESVVETY